MSVFDVVLHHGTVADVSRVLQPHSPETRADCNRALSLAAILALYEPERAPEMNGIAEVLIAHLCRKEGP